MKLLSTLSLVFLFSLPAVACTCSDNPSFFEMTIAGTSYDTAGTRATVVRARVADLITDDYRYPRLVLEINEVLHGTYSESRVILLGQDGGNCNRNLDGLAIDDHLYVYFWAEGYSSYHNTNFPATDFPVHNFSPCGTGFVTANNGTVTGAIAPGLGSLDETSFVTTLLDDIAAGEVSVSTGAPLTVENSELRVFPNPTDELINVELPRDETVLAFSLYDQQGRVVISQEVVAGAERLLTLPVGRLASGCYYARVRCQRRVYAARFVVR